MELGLAFISAEEKAWRNIKKLGIQNKEKKAATGQFGPLILAL
jgi:hypothetical protein